MKLRLMNFLPILIAFPAVFIGVLAMFFNKVPMLIWIQNIVFFVIAGIVSYLFIKYMTNMSFGKVKPFFILIPLLFLLCTFFSPGLNGVHRWVSIGVIQVNVAMVMLPVALLLLWKLTLRSFNLTAAVVLTISVILFLQPDASQLTSFTIPAMLLLLNAKARKSISLFVIVILLALITSSWIYLDKLSAVAYVEGILGLAANMGLVWFTLGIFSLLLLPVPFLLFPPKTFVLPSICVGIYISINLISVFFGKFPVPLMGYGVSPIVGYFIAVTWYVRAKVYSVEDVLS